MPVSPTPQHIRDEWRSQTEGNKKTRAKRKHVSKIEELFPDADPVERAIHEAKIAEKSDHIRRARDENERVRIRLEDGFYWEACEINGAKVPAGHEYGLRSDSSLNMLLFSRMTPRIYRGKMVCETAEDGRTRKRLRHFAEGVENGLQAGNSKGFLPLACGRKLHALDLLYVKINSRMVRGFRVDLDRVFASVSEMREGFRALVDAGKLPCMPHIVNWLKDEAWLLGGYITNPHVWFLLPPDAAVWCDRRRKDWGKGSRDERCREAPIRLLDAVIRGATAALIPMGADISATSQPFKGKSPLCPMTEYVEFNDDTYPILSQWAEYVDPRLRRTEVERMQAEHDLAGVCDSNMFFAEMNRGFIGDLRAMHESRDPEYLETIKEGGDIRALLVRRCATLIDDWRSRPENPKSAKRIERAIDRVLTSVAEWWDDGKARAWRNIGACREKVEGLETTYERQAVGGAYSAEQVSLKHKRKVVEVRDRLRAECRPCRQKDVEAETGFAHATIVKYWHVRAADLEEPLVAAEGISVAATAAPVESRPVLVPQIAPMKTGNGPEDIEVEGHLARIVASSIVISSEVSKPREDGVSGVELMEGSVEGSNVSKVNPVAVIRRRFGLPVVSRVGESTLVESAGNRVSDGSVVPVDQGKVETVETMVGSVVSDDSGIPVALGQPVVSQPPVALGFRRRLRPGVVSMAKESSLSVPTVGSDALVVSEAQVVPEAPQVDSKALDDPQAVPDDSAAREASEALTKERLASGRWIRQFERRRDPDGRPLVPIVRIIELTDEQVEERRRLEAKRNLEEESVGIPAFLLPGAAAESDCARQEIQRLMDAPFTGVRRRR